MQRIKKGNKMMKSLYRIIEEKALAKNVKEIKQSIEEMITNDSLLPLPAITLQKALECDGEFQIVTMQYDDIENEIKTHSLKHLIKSSLHIVVSFEEDGYCFEKIQQFCEYLYKYSSLEQSLSIGVKKVSNLSKTPVRILFTGMLPINQLEMFIGEKLQQVISEEPEYFEPLFAVVREKITQKIGVPLLPLYPEVDKTLPPYGVKLIDPLDNGKTIIEFEIDECRTKEEIDKYLIKLYHIYVKLAKEQKQKL